jgi:hypothetical protein
MRESEEKKYRKNVNLQMPTAADTKSLIAVEAYSEPPSGKLLSLPLRTTLGDIFSD